MKAAALGLVLMAGPMLQAADEGGFQSLFNGRDLTGWDGNPRFWSVRDGAITGQTTKENPTKGNTFLIWKGGNVDDFELRFSYKIVANNDKGFANSGVQYRSKVTSPANWGVGGYQADFEAGTTYSGILYDEGGVAGGRGIMAERGQKVTWDKECRKQVTGSVGSSDAIQAKIKKDDWNEYVVIARGNHLVHQINGTTTVEVTDECESKALKSGALAFQVHAGEPMTVQVKDIRLKRLSATVKSDLDRIQGEWAPVELVANGQVVAAGDLAGLSLRIKGTEYEVDTLQGSDAGTFKLNEGAQPRRMDVTSGNGGEVPAIYEAGADTLKVCYAVNGASRPTAFKSDAGSDHIYVLYRRKGARAAKSDLEQLQGNWVPTEMVVNGERIPEGDLATFKVMVKGNEYQTETTQGSDEGSFKLIDSATPKRMDVTSRSGSELPAIYEVSGDIFKACYAMNGAARPTEFRSTSGSDHILIIYKRKAD